MNRLSTFLIGNQAPHDSYGILRVLMMRCIGLIYLNASLILFFQGTALWGTNGLLPIADYVAQVQDHFGSPWASFWNLPSLFYFFQGDTYLKILPLAGIGLSLMLLFGYGNFIILFLLWLLQLSFVNSGQLFYGYGWETQILELTFLSFFLVPLWQINLKKTSVPAARVVIWAMRWELFRLMLGAGLIKIRGDDCWRDLTCLIYHYETQPNPNPLSFFYHQMPPWFHYGGVLFNHFVELIVPFGFFGPPKIRRAAGVLAAIFQLILISSGNLAWLNWLTLFMCLACFDDEFILRFLPPLIPWRRMKILKPDVANGRLDLKNKASSTRLILLTVFAVSILVLSFAPALNLLRSDQAMNTSYSNWHLVNSYGAFGSIGRERDEVIIEGTDDPAPSTKTSWRPYEFHCAPGDLNKIPCWISPYHYHLDWQIWFSSMRPELEEEWLFRLAVRLLENDAAVTGLFRFNPFVDKPPKFIRMELYRYEFVTFKDWPHAWWKRTFVHEYMPPISLETPFVQKFRKP